MGDWVRKGLINPRKLEKQNNITHWDPKFQIRKNTDARKKFPYNTRGVMYIAAINSPGENILNSEKQFPTNRVQPKVCSKKELIDDSSNQKATTAKYILFEDWKV